MEIDFSALASRVAAFSDVLGCIILSTDGLVLGAFPPGDEDRVKPAWLRFATLGEPERGFVRFSGSEIWAYVRAGQYAAFAVAVGSTRPGVLLDHLEQALAVAQESRDKLEVGRAPERVELTVETRPRSIPAMNESPAQPVEASPSPEPEHEAAEAVAGAWDAGGGGMDQAEDPAVSPGVTHGSEEHGHEPEAEAEQRPEPEEIEVDRVVLAREFAGLLQEDHSRDEE